MDVSDIVIAAHTSIVKNELEFYREDMAKRVKDGFPAFAAFAMSVGYLASKEAELRQHCIAIRQHYAS